MVFEIQLLEILNGLRSSPILATLWRSHFLLAPYSALASLPPGIIWYFVTLAVVGAPIWSSPRSKLCSALSNHRQGLRFIYTITAAGGAGNSVFAYFRLRLPPLSGSKLAAEQHAVASAHRGTIKILKYLKLKFGK